MIYTLMLGAPIRIGDQEFGTLSRILVNNGVANQLTVNPRGLFSGPDRVVPISDIVEATADAVTLGITEREWKAYPAFHIDRMLAADQAANPTFLPMNATNQVANESANMPPSEPQTTERTTSVMSVALTNDTRVGNGGTLAGIVADTGIPQQLLLQDGTAVPFEQVGVLDEAHIVLGPVGGRLDGASALDETAVPERMDRATPPGTIGQERRHDP